MKISIIFLLTLYSLSFSQNLVELYENYIPKEYIRDIQSRQMISMQLENKAKIHPELIYYFIVGLETRLDKSISEVKREKINGAIEEAEKAYVSKRENWARNQIEFIRNSDDEMINERIKKNSEKYFTKLIVKKEKPFGEMGTWTLKPKETKEKTADSSVVKKDIPVEDLEYGFSPDSNLMNYFILLYLSNFIKKYKNYETENDNEMKSLFLNDNKIELYKSHKSYKEDRIGVEHEIIAQYEEIYKSLNKGSNCSDLDLVYDFLGFWYFFEAPDREEYYIGYKAWEFVSTFFSCNYRQAKPPTFSFGISYSPLNRWRKISSEIYINGLESYEKFDTSIEFDQMGICVNYRYYLRNDFYIFSYLNFQLSVSNSLSKVSKDFNAGFLIKEGTRILRSLKFNLNKLTVNSVTSLGTKVSTPIFVFSNRFILEAGVLFWIDFYSYELQYNYFFVQNSPTPLVARSDGDVSENVSYNNSNIIPVFDLIYRAPRHFSFTFSVLVKYISFTVAYNF